MCGHVINDSGKKKKCQFLMNIEKLTITPLYKQQKVRANVFWLSGSKEYQIIFLEEFVCLNRDKNYR